MGLLDDLAEEVAQRERGAWQAGYAAGYAAGADAGQQQERARVQAALRRLYASHRWDYDLAGVTWVRTVAAALDAPLGDAPLGDDNDSADTAGNDEQEGRD